MRYLLALVLTLAAIATSAPSAGAEQTCPAAPLTFQQADMAGVYINMAGPMRVEIFPCGGSTILWDNAYGRHLAVYTSVERLTGGGVIARGFTPDPAVGYLDNCYTVAFKPGTPGTIEVYTVSPYGQFVGMYRLDKV
jgi:hypothetical protein